MSINVRDHLTLVWAGLVAASLISLWLGTDHGFSGEDGKTIGTALVLAVAFVKIHFIGAHFMELRTAPLLLRLAFEAWCVLIGAAVIVLYVAG